MPFFKAFLVHRPILNRVLLDDFSSPFVEPYCTLIIYLKTNSNNHLQIVMNYFTIHLPGTFGLNYPEFPDNWLLNKFIICINFLYDHWLFAHPHHIKSLTSFVSAIYFHPHSVFQSRLYYLTSMPHRLNIQQPSCVT